MFHSTRSAARLTLMSAIAAITVFLAACGGNSAITAPFSATDLIQKASDNFGKTTSLHFKLTASDIAPGLYAVTNAEGDVVRPDKLQISGVAEISAGTAASLAIIIIGDKQFLAFGGSKDYSPISGLPDLLAIFSTDQGIGAILKQFKNPSVPTADTVNGQADWKLSGTVDSTLLNPFTGSTSTTVVPIQTTLWVSQSDLQIHQVKLVGKATDGDSDKSTRTFTLSNYNKSVTIVDPTTK